jgi:PIN domain nuclease of toxin-antitoxin system
LTLNADELVVADITWFELAWLARNGRIGLSIPLASWLGQLAAQVRTRSRAQARGRRSGRQWRCAPLTADLS